MPVNLWRDLDRPLTEQEADGSLIFLRDLQVVETGRLLYAGGIYLTPGGVSHQLPLDGNSVRVISITAPFTILTAVDGSENTEYAAGRVHWFAKLDDAWTTVVEQSATDTWASKLVTTNAVPSEPRVWFENTNPVQYNLPSDAVIGETYSVVRGWKGTVAVVVPEGQTVTVARSDGTIETDTEVTINNRQRIAVFRLGDTGWFMAE